MCFNDELENGDALNADLVEATELNLKRQHNSLAIINRLPDEILQTVFVCLRASYEDEFKTTIFHYLYVPHWIAITWTCHRFRAISLDYPLLWSHIRDFKRPWLFAFLERSGVTTLDVKVNAHYHEQLPLERILQHTSRMRILNLEGSSRGMCNQILPLLKHEPACEMRMLSLRFDDDYDVDDAAQERAIDCLTNAFARQAPLLRDLSIRCIIPLHSTTSLLSPLLESLDLEGPYTAPNLASLLQAAAGLRSLSVRGRIPESSRASHGPSNERVPFLSLPRLSSLDIYISFDEQVAHLLHHLKVPALRFTRLMLTGSANSNLKSGNIDTAFSALSSVLRQSHEGKPFLSVRLHPVSYSSGFQCVAHLWHSPRAGAETKYSYPHPIKPDAIVDVSPRSSHWTLPLAVFVPLYKHACNILPLLDVNTLTIEMHYTFTPKQWADILRPLARVEHLKLIGDNLITVLSALVPTPFIFPNLSRIAVHLSEKALRNNAFLPELVDVGKTRADVQRLAIAFEDCARGYAYYYRTIGKFAKVTWRSSKSKGRRSPD
ncbi:unnamed protein product [Peniophora sp. CBMAI 1063]|nr:unnamed protein product [Peniophora sp. CBMAI 1063]